MIVSASEEHVPVLLIHFYYHVAVRTLRALMDIVHMGPVVRHEITDLGVVRADIEMQTVILIEFILQREAADWAAHAEKIDRLHVDILAQGELEISYHFNKETGRFILRNGDINAILCPCQSNVEEPTLFGKRYADILVRDELHDGIVLYLTWEPEFPLEHIYKDHVVITEPLRAVSGHKRSIRFGVFYAHEFTVPGVLEEG